MKASSLTHLTAVSGANCAIVVGFAFAAAAACGRGAACVWASHWWRSAGFVALVTPEPSVIRAAAMAAIGMLAVLLGRTGAGVAVLCAAVIVLLVADPWLGGSLGFCLSVLATGALLLLAPPLAEGTDAVDASRDRARPVGAAGGPAGVRAAHRARLAHGARCTACSPTSWPVPPPRSPPSSGCSPAWRRRSRGPPPSSPRSPGSRPPGSRRRRTRWPDCPEALLPWVDGWPGVALLAALGGALALVIAPSGRARRADAVIRWIAGIGLATTVGVVCGAVALGGVAGPLTVPGDWSIAACDVGQGDAVLLRSEGVVALIDTGPEPAPLTACLSRVGLGRIHLLVLTHFDLDHVGGVDAVVGRVDTVIHGPPASAEDRAIVAALRAAGARTVEGHAGLGGRLGAASWHIEWPRAVGSLLPRRQRRQRRARHRGRRHPAHPAARRPLGGGAAGPARQRRPRRLVRGREDRPSRQRRPGRGAVRGAGPGGRARHGGRRQRLRASAEGDARHPALDRGGDRPHRSARHDHADDGRRRASRCGASAALSERRPG